MEVRLSFTFRPLYQLRKSGQQAWHRRLDGPQSLCGRLPEVNILDPSEPFQVN
jgi:hypothetical protein